MMSAANSIGEHSWFPAYPTMIACLQSADLAKIVFRLQKVPEMMEACEKGRRGTVAYPRAPVLSAISQQSQDRHIDIP